MNNEVVADYTELSRRCAEVIAAFIRENRDSLLCLAAGDTPLGAYAQLVTMQASGEVDLSSVYYAGLDEWVGLGPKDKGSCYQVMFDHLYGPARIPGERLHVFNGLGDPVLECKAMNQWLADRGPLALAVVGVGMNGHIGFNEPDVPAVDGAIMVSLDTVTKTVSTKYFGAERPVTMGITIGLNTLYQAQRILVLASGEKKAPVIQEAFYGPKTPSIAASMLQDHRNLTLLLDTYAAG